MSDEGNVLDRPDIGWHRKGYRCPDCEYYITCEWAGASAAVHFQAVKDVNDHRLDHRTAEALGMDAWQQGEATADPYAELSVEDGIAAYSSHA